MQDGAPRHSAKDTQVNLNEHGPAFSPDLNHIETEWDRMKDFIERHYPEEHSSYDKLRHVMKEAWKLSGANDLFSLGKRNVCKI